VLERMLICSHVYLVEGVVEKVEEQKELREQRKQEDVDVKKVIIILY
jgi:hypothetical protein